MAAAAALYARADEDEDVDMDGDSGVAAAPMLVAAAPATAFAAAAGAAVGSSSASSSSSSGSAGSSGYAPVSAGSSTPLDVETRQVRVPSHRYTPLRENWAHIMRPLVEFMKIDVRFNPTKRWVEMRKSAATTDPGALAKAYEFVNAFMCGFDVRDAIALLRLDDLRVGE
jgi:hypothetical protein